MVREERRAIYHERHREFYCYRSRSCFARLVLSWTAIWDFKVQKTNLSACLLKSDLYSSSYVTSETNLCSIHHVFGV
jgi:hypothetical protein